MTFSAPSSGFHARLYAVAVVAIAAAVLVRRQVDPWLGSQVPYLLFFPAVLISAWYGGFGPGALATALGSVTAMYLYLPPDGLAVEATSILSLSLFAATGLAIAGLNHRLRAAQRAYRVEADLATARAERLHAIIDTTVDGIIVIGERGTVEAFNRGAERLFGYPAAEVIGRNVNMLMPSPDHEAHDGYLSRYLATGRAKIIGTGREVTGRRRDGTTFPLHLSVGELTIGGERKFTGILHDLTARVRMEETIREQMALAKLGEMAAVIAHEVKNPLAGIRGVIQVLAAREAKSGTAPPILNEIVSRIDALDAMMKDLLLFARPPTPKRAPTDLVPLVAATADLLRADPSLRNVDVDVVGSAPPVPADAEMLRLVFQNLLINGAHAMEGRGRIAVAVNAIDAATCQIAFSDDGPGIPADVREKIFTPFFTTKRRGTGLGLPTARRMVEAHNGEIVIDCPPAGGTTVVVRLPLHP